MASRGHFHVRVEDPEWRFLERIGDKPPFDAAIVKASHVAPYPESDGRHGGDCDLAIKTLEEKNVQWTLDPATAQLGHPAAAEKTSARTRECPIASSTPLPWDSDRLASRDGALEVVEAAEALQRNATALAAPYLEVGPAGDPRIAATCRMIEVAAELAGRRRTVAYLQVLRSHLRDGSARAAAKKFIDAGAQTVMIRVRRLDPLNLADLLPYLELIEMIEAEGAHPVADCVGPLGPMLVAGGADAFTAGARFFQKVPDKLLESGGGGGDGSQKMPYLVPGRLSLVAPDQVGEHLPACAEEECPAEGGLSKATGKREHNLHEYKRASREAAAAGYGFVETLRALPGADAAIWASALEQRRDQRRAA